MTMKCCGVSFFLLVLCACVQLPAQQANSDQKSIANQRDISKLIQMSGGIESFRGVINQYKEQLQKLRPDVPAKFWDGFFAETNWNGMIDLAIPIYQKHFTEDEIKQMIALKESPLGRKMTQEMPEISRELVIAGQKWGESLGEKIQAQLQATNVTAVNANTDPTDRPIFRSLTREEVSVLQSRGIDASQYLSGKFLVYPKGWDNPDTSQPLKITEQNAFGSWRMWNQTEGETGYNETTLTFMPGGKMNYLLTTVWYQQAINPLTQAVSYTDQPSSQSQVAAGTWKLVDGYISYDITNLVSTAEKVISITAKRLTCISGINGRTYVMHHVSP